MSTVNMLEAKTHLSKLVEALEKGNEAEIIIARNGRPVARLLPFNGAATGKRIGVAEGKISVPDDLDELNEDIADLFEGKSR